ncbi:Rossmann-like and DUF2520 domain-containing protein [Malonomonas rubra]|uniref:Rossmann-like and DUF2520 domain-containing protein n=1 Tax=Malonomonas rubra TaxID=57040 RepID=UPI0026EEE8A9|nr:Rossmann-like and DUF2520 domain-containing protein [Malonomonas rubra]
MKPSLALIGPGKVGCAVSKRLRQAGYSISAVISRDLSRAVDACSFIGCTTQTATTDLQRASSATLILLAVPDDQITGLASNLTQQLSAQEGRTLLHFSGLHPAEIMRSPGCQATLLSIHPLLSFADRQLASERLYNCPCAVEGEEIAVQLGKELVSAFGGRPFRIASDQKALYHASACIASNFLVTLLATATKLLGECGIDQQQAGNLLSPLIKTTIENVTEFGPEQGLTGPIVRGDQGTVATHIAALEKVSLQIGMFYKFLGCSTVELAQKSGRLQPADAEKLEKILGKNF